MSRRAALALCAPLLVAPPVSGSGSGSGNGDDAGAPAPAPEEALRAELVALAERRMAEHDVPGLALLLIRGGEEAWFEGLGLADVEAGTPVTRDTVFNVGSISKCVAAWGVMRLVEAGAIGLDEPVVPRLARWSPPRSSHDPDGITVRRLLSHTAGLSVSGIGAYDEDEEVPPVEEELAKRTASSGRVRLVDEPGARFAYSGGGYMVLQLLAEELSGRGFAELLREEVLRPLGMERSDFGWTDAGRRTAATPYNRRGRPIEEQRFAGVAAAGLQTTAADLARFAVACLPAHRGEAAERVLPRAALEAMQAPAVEGLPWGLGFQLHDRGGRRVVGHTGANHGWIAGLHVVPETGDGLVLLANGTNADRFLAELERAWGRFLERERDGAREPREARYRLRIGADDPRLLHVEADVPLGGRTLSLGGGHALPEGRSWSDWLRELEVRTPEGEPIVWLPNGRDRCRLRGELPERARLTYRIRLEHDALAWPTGPAEASFVRADAVFFRSHAVLVAPEGVERVRVAFDLPEGWRVSTSLPAALDAESEHVADARAGFGGATLVGRHAVSEVLVRGVRVELAVTGDLPGAAGPLEAAVANALRGAVDLFGDAPAGRFTVIAARHPEPGASGGSGFPGGVAVLLGANPADEPKGGWAHTLTHELLHLWNGVALSTGGAQEAAWFTEGVTDYLALVIAGRRGLVRDGWRLAWLARAWDAYRERAGERSLTAAGFEPREHAGLVYGGGLLVGLLLDLRLREQGGGLRIDDLMRALWVERSLTAAPITTDDVERLAVALAGPEAATLFARHVHGKRRIDPADFLQPLGLVSEASRIAPDPDAPSAARRLRYAVLGIE